MQQGMVVGKMWNSMAGYMGFVTDVLTVIVLLLAIAALWKYLHHSR